MINWIKTASGSVIAKLFGGNSVKTYTFDKGHPEYDILIEAMENDDEVTFMKTIDTGTFVEGWSMGHFKFDGRRLLYKDEPISSTLEQLILDMVEHGNDYRPLMRFLHKTYTGREGISDDLYRLRVDSLWRFLENNKLPILENGDFLAYKYVDIYQGQEIQDLMGNTIKEGDLVDSHTGESYRNNPGDTPRMEVTGVCTDLAECAGSGLHVGNWSYARRGDANVLVSVSPQNVVVVPSYDASKIRTTGYTVLRKIDKDFKEVKEPVYYIPEVVTEPKNDPAIDFNIF